jgi:CRP-like cAMP-binding protein
MSERRETPINKEFIEPHLCSTELRLDILQQVPFFTGLSETEVGKINLLFKEQGFSAGETVYFIGQPAGRLYVVADGSIKLMHHTTAGKDVMLDILKKGDFFGSLAMAGDERYSETAVAQTECCVLGIDSESFRRIMQDYPPVSLSVIDIMAERLHAAREMIRQLSAYSVEQRLAHILLKLGDKLGEKQETGLLIQLPVSRADLAEMVGTTTETASRVLSNFQENGLIQSGRRWVSIVDYAGLTARKQD